MCIWLVGDSERQDSCWKLMRAVLSVWASLVLYECWRPYQCLLAGGHTLSFTLVAGEGEYVVVHVGQGGIPPQQSPLGSHVQGCEIHRHVHRCGKQTVALYLHLDKHKPQTAGSLCEIVLIYFSLCATHFPLLFGSSNTDSAAGAFLMNYTAVNRCLEQIPISLISKLTSKGKMCIAICKALKILFPRNLEMQKNKHF